MDFKFKVGDIVNVDFPNDGYLAFISPDIITSVKNKNPHEITRINSSSIPGSFERYTLKNGRGRSWPDTMLTLHKNKIPDWEI